MTPLARPAAALLCILPLASLAPARTARAAQTVTPCNIGAYVIDPDPHGLNVRAAPSANARVVRRLHRDDFVEVTGASGTWLRVRNAENEDSIFWRGTGWAFAQKLGTSTNDPRTVSLYREPRHGSAVVSRLDPTQVTLLGCRGEWAQVHVANLTGWLDAASQCANTLTTCS
jgi:SH3-like domain-containing protein